MPHCKSIQHPAARVTEARLCILATSDLHAHLLAYDYYADTPTDTAGLARVGTLVEQARAGADNCLLLDNGDFLTGNPFGDHIASDAGPHGPTDHPVIVAMNVLGYDAAALGNHEFNYGLPFLNRALEDAGFSIVCANIFPNGQNSAAWVPFVLIERLLVCADGALRPIRIGITGFAPPQIIVWDRAVLKDSITVEDIVPAARRVVPQMRAAGADLVIVLAHSGIAGTKPLENMENAAAALAQMPGIDALIAGHTHLVFPSGDHPAKPGVAPVAGRLGGKPAVMPGFWGSHLGRIDLDLRDDGIGWRVAGSKATALPIMQRDSLGHVTPLVSSHPAIQRSVTPAHEAAVSAMREVVGHSDVALNSFFSMLGPCPCLHIVNAAQVWHLRSFCADLPPGMPVLSATAPFKTGGRAGPSYFTDIPAGPLMRRNIADLYPFPNTICAVQVTGLQLREWLEYSASVYHTHGPGQPEQMLTDPDFPSYLCDTILGVSYGIDITAPPLFSADGHKNSRNHDGRIRALTREGQTIRDSDAFVVAVNSYRASVRSGNRGFFGCERQIYAAPALNRDILLAYLKAGCPELNLHPPDWRLLAPSGASSLFDTAPRAVEVLDQIAAFAPQNLGLTSEGFARLRLKL